MACSSRGQWGEQGNRAAHSLPPQGQGWEAEAWQCVGSCCPSGAPGPVSPAQGLSPWGEHGSKRQLQCDKETGSKRWVGETGPWATPAVPVPAWPHPRWVSLVGVFKTSHSLIPCVFGSGIGA